MKFNLLVWFFLLVAFFTLTNADIGSTADFSNESYVTQYNATFLARLNASEISPDYFDLILTKLNKDAPEKERDIALDHIINIFGKRISLYSPFSNLFNYLYVTPDTSLKTHDLNN